LAKLESHYFISTTGHSHKRQGYDAHQEEAIQRTKSHASGSADFARWVEMCAFTDYCDANWNNKRKKNVSRTTPFPFIEWSEWLVNVKLMGNLGCCDINDLSELYKNTTNFGRAERLKVANLMFNLHQRIPKYKQLKFFHTHAAEAAESTRKSQLIAALEPMIVILHKKFKIEMRTLNDEFGLDALLNSFEKIKTDIIEKAGVEFNSRTVQTKKVPSLNTVKKEAKRTFLIEWLEKITNVNEQLEERKRILISNEILEQAGELEEE